MRLQYIAGISSQPTEAQMDSQTRESMKKELLEASGDFGRGVGLGVFAVLGFAGTLVPAIDILMKSENTWYWPIGVFAALSGYAGYRVNASRRKNLEQKFATWDDDGLKFAHDKVREKRILSKIATYLLIAVVVLYFVLR
ncbi:MAG: hypothetical protein J0M28_10935 [Thauera sp.]|nr:hypothetical protein [Thauera sp.]